MDSYYVCILTVLSVMLMILWLVGQYHRTNRETEERLRSVQQTLDGVLGRLGPQEDDRRKEERTEGPRQIPEDGTLTAEGVVEAVRSAGFEPREKANGVAFVKDDETYVIDTRRMPRIFISKSFRIKPEEWDLGLMRQAAHLMSDDIIMLKACIDDKPDEDGDMCLTFFLAAMDRTLQCFRENLADYLKIINHGQQRLGEKYARLAKEKEDVTSLSALADSSFRHGRKTPS